ncbi:MAG: type IX secretion system sortase PorU [Paludibacter sp.]|nr:type IX secretion system sortase PorU [Bacteroidales bacterium]MCM1068845.1 type IX secretion system sortase PorU [Prevotella sp.]MCM1353106.1 type IX secretion system sortase PorU [Bacteroides sp.]MCM1442428.1 type IX secretion system sortase PorU [Muribaculum sp.]MCM1481271.1 type IX secretion system sortase PorU [Paludibacter sp.]
MKRLIESILLLILGCGTAFASLQSYTNVSVLSKGNFVKIRTAESGVYRLTYEEIRDMGLRPEQVRIYGYGGALLDMSFSTPQIDDLPLVPYYKYTGSDGVFGAGDYILFYAQGVVKWQYNGDSFRWIHSMNTYSEYGYYFLTDTEGASDVLDVRRTTLNVTEAYDVTTFSDCRLHEEELVNLVDASGLSGGGREWYGECLTSTEPILDLRFTMPNIVEGTLLRCYVDMAANSSENVQMQVSSGGGTRSFMIASMEGQSTTTTAMSGFMNAQLTPANGNVQTIRLTYSNPTPTAKAYLNYVELTAQRELILTDNLMLVRNVEHYGDSKASVYHVRGASAETQVWNVTRLDSIYSVPTEWDATGAELRFLAENTEVQDLLVINPTRCAWHKPVTVGRVEHQNLHGLRDIDMVIITPASFVGEAQRLAEAHEEYDGLTTAVVAAEEVYNEFSSGTPDATAYRRIMKMLYDRANDSDGREHAPRYLLLMGDGSFDNRKLLHTSPENILLTYQARNSLSEVEGYATDDYFTYLDDNESTNDVSSTMDISVGRLPVNTQVQAAEVTDKIIRYIRNESVGAWKQQICFLADDGDSGTHTRGADLAAEAIRADNPDFVVNKIYIDAYQQTTEASGESYPLAKNKLDNLLHNGVLFFGYSGHGGYNNITNEGLLDAQQIRQMSNSNLGFWLFATCSFAHFDSYLTSAAEEAVLNPNGGALAILSACRTVYANQNDYLSKNICTALFEHDAEYKYTNTIGDAIRIGKNRLKQEPVSRDKNMLAYILLGDPAVKLNYPDNYRIGISLAQDTLSALSSPVVEGAIMRADGDTVTDFNGLVTLNVWDKMQKLTTLDNDQSDASKKVKYSYVDYPNLMFKGDAEVENGKFSIRFMVPKDIRYNYGQGRIVCYAYDSATQEEAIGHAEDFVVGGSSDVLIADNEGPDLHVYLNNPAFTNGGKTNEFPHFYADIADEHGINTVGSGIGHDLTMVVDNDSKQTYILNEYFTAETNSCQSGRVSYRLAEMEEGRHSLLFRAWDLLNNSSTAQLDFEVVKGLEPSIFSVMMYPNPVSRQGTVTLVVQHDKPDAVLQTLVTLYDMSGRMVWQYEQTGTENMTWNMGDIALTTGLYLYRVQIRTEDSAYTSKTGKLIITQ